MQYFKKAVAGGAAMTAKQETTMDRRQNMRINHWKTAVVTTLLTMAAGPALASDATFNSNPIPAHPSAETANLDGAQARVGSLEQRVEELEKRVDQLSAPPPAPTEAERQRQQREQERQAEFLNQVWTAP
jgi:hypothetical protein